MAVDIRLKRSSVPGKIPTTASLDLGEIALNTYDGKAYMKKQVGTTQSIVEIGSGSGGAGGTVTSVSVTSANGFAGSVANPTTSPAITLSTTVTGILKGNGTSISAATAGTDYITPTQGTASWAVNAVTASYFSGSISNSVSASYASYSVSASYALSSVSASYAPTLPNVYIQDGNSFGTQAVLGTNDVQNLAFETSGSIRMLISSSGNVGVNTTTPLYTFDVNGTGRFVSIIETSTRTLKDNIQPYTTDTEDRKSTRLNSSHVSESRMPSSA